ncbi:MAG: Beta-lactamase domain protein [Parcubacteria group bacterium Gr01-1014_48]|nr:MAG: Beta-lactamase domain protein [Parcubacteria group bacterium Greene0416_14]TSC74186.1 MAG: Beta-lactamase domain protein [Parcubacteria group bacterium Gr01-1014_48]TSD00862.1 MAG: Beta-lactamase domain protein [Parcubacteria group bacterium Greene1014_15]TSD07944.1 MAG: Beta-lactamase domain protein [Parcubacteria group bacterium Greene0714_4]
MKANIQFIVLAFLFAVTTGIVYATILEDRGHILKVAFLDIGQGDAIYIEAPNGNQVLIDGGKNKAVLSELSKIMPLYDRSIDMVIGTHPDQDHIGGLPYVLKNYTVALLLDPALKKESGTYEALLSAARKHGTRYIVARRGQRFVLDRDIVLSILFPDRDMPHVDTNIASIVAKLTYGNTSFLFTGDSPKNVEAYLLVLDDKALDVDVLKVGHHGSRTSSGEKFLKIVTPMVSVISAGKNNEYGHPHKEVLAGLTSVGAKILGTYEKGTIVLFSDGEKIGLK